MMNVVPCKNMIGNMNINNIERQGLVADYVDKLDRSHFNSLRKNANAIEKLKANAKYTQSEKYPIFNAANEIIRDQYVSLFKDITDATIRKYLISAVRARDSWADHEWELHIHHKQQRLLVLHHAASCLHNDGRCLVTPHCAAMKLLWVHLEGCKNNQCLSPLCFSSRVILSHYWLCKDAACTICGPVREILGRSHNNTGSSNSGSNRPSSSCGGTMRQVQQMSQQQHQPLASHQVPPTSVGAPTDTFDCMLTTKSAPILPPVSKPAQLMAVNDSVVQYGATAAVARSTSPATMPTSVPLNKNSKSHILFYRRTI